MSIRVKALPKILTFSEAKYYVFSAVFVSSAVFFPWLAHQFQVAGAQFLPMHFFVMFAGFLFGWRTGLLVGLISPLLSYSITQMPAIAILPEVTLELAVYGLAIGLLRERSLNIAGALVGAMILGRLARWAFVFALGLQTNPLNYFKIGLPGIILQLALIPIVVYLLQKFVFKKNEEAV
jgi:LytS/YehU family sensor histidine kinase